MSKQGGGVEFILLLDASSSMMAITDKVKEAARKCINDAKESGLYDEPKIFAFCNEMVQLNTIDDYIANGETALYDAIGITLEEITEGALLVIATDGEDTCSANYTRENIKESIHFVKTHKDVKVIYIAEGEEAINQGTSIGLDSQSKDIAEGLSQVFETQNSPVIFSKKSKVVN